MHYNSKYVILDLMAATPIIFSDVMGHDDMAMAFGGPERVMSAGFCYFDTEKKEYVCFGESISLKKKARPVEDAFILNRYLGVTAQY